MYEVARARGLFRRDDFVLLYGGFLRDFFDKLQVGAHKIGVASDEVEFRHKVGGFGEIVFDVYRFELLYDGHASRTFVFAFLGALEFDGLPPNFIVGDKLGVGEKLLVKFAYSLYVFLCQCAFEQRKFCVGDLFSESVAFASGFGVVGVDLEIVLITASASSYLRILMARR